MTLPWFYFVQNALVNYNLAFMRNFFNILVWITEQTSNAHINGRSANLLPMFQDVCPPQRTPYPPLFLILCFKNKKRAELVQAGLPNTPKQDSRHSQGLNERSFLANLCLALHIFSFREAELLNQQKVGHNKEGGFHSELVYFSRMCNEWSWISHNITSPEENRKLIYHARSHEMKQILFSVK